MSITQALGNAFSGLGAATRASEIVSRNIANASTEGYSATALVRGQQMNGATGAGVRIDGTERASNPLLTADRRRADATAGRAQADAQTLRQLSDLAADPDGGDSLSGRVLAMENALRGLADTPESPAMQSTAAAAGRALAKRFNTISTETTRMRADLDADIRQQVDTVNSALTKIGKLNSSIAAAAASGRDTTALEDQRDREIETVNSIIPIRTKNRDAGGMMISTMGGTVLLEGSARPITLVDAPADPAAETQGNPRFAVDGYVFGALDETGGMRGGSLEASVKALSRTIPDFEKRIDTAAHDLVVRFQNLAGYDTTDNSTTPATPLAGLFTIDGGRYDAPLDVNGNPVVTGVAAKITFNVEADPVEGGNAAYLASGLIPGGQRPDPAAVPSAETFPTAIMAAMRQTSPSRIAGVDGSYNAVDLAIGLVAVLEVDASAQESEASFQRAAVTSLREEELGITAVDTDAELRDLLRIEQAYQANARVLQTVNSLIDTLLEL